MIALFLLLTSNRIAEDDGDHLPTVTYSTMKDKQLRELLDHYNLSTAGDRAAMIARHTK